MEKIVTKETGMTNCCRDTEDCIEPNRMEKKNKSYPKECLKQNGELSILHLKEK